MTAQGSEASLELSHLRRRLLTTHVCKTQAPNSKENMRQLESRIPKVTGSSLERGEEWETGGRQKHRARPGCREGRRKGQRDKERTLGVSSV